MYECPKPLRTSEDINRIIIETKDAHFIYPDECIKEPWIWSILMWGSNRDRDLIRRLYRYPTLEKLKEVNLVRTREGIIWGDRKKKEPSIQGKVYVGHKEFAAEQGLYLYPERLHPITDPHIDNKASSDFTSFKLPQLLLKTSWVQQTQRFQAKLVRSKFNEDAVICSQSFINVNVDPEREALLEVYCACYNSNFATYFFFLISGRFAFDRSELLTTEMRSLPLPTKPAPGILENLDRLESLDHRVYELFSLKEAEIILIEEMLQYTLLDFGSSGFAVEAPK